MKSKIVLIVVICSIIYWLIGLFAGLWILQFLGIIPSFEKGPVIDKLEIEVLNKPSWFDSQIVRMPDKSSLGKDLYYVEHVYGELGRRDWKRSVRAYYAIIDRYPSPSGQMVHTTVAHCYHWMKDNDRAIAEYEWALHLAETDSRLVDL
jgi:hypothetical protein